MTLSTFYNVSGHDLAVEWGGGVVAPGESVDVDVTDEQSGLPAPDWSSDRKDAERFVVAGGDGLTEADKATYAKHRKAKAHAEPAPADDAASDAASEATDPAADVPAETKES